MKTYERFALVLLGTLVGNLGRIFFGGMVETLFLVAAAFIVFAALGMVELAMALWYRLRRVAVRYR